MAKLNVPTKPPKTHEGAAASTLTPLQQLERTVAACLLWEDNFYESGVGVAERIKVLVPQVPALDVARLAVHARTVLKLRHAPLLLVREMARHATHKGLVAQALAAVIDRADELTEFLAIYWKDEPGPNRSALSAQVKKGLAAAFVKFDAYQLAKYDRPGPVKLRDVLFLSHAKPLTPEQDALWKQLITGTLPPPNTWESRMAAGEDKKSVFLDLLERNKLGYMALLRNLRGMLEVGVPQELITRRLLEGAARNKALPFRYVAAARACPEMTGTLDVAMQKALEGMDRLPGRTAVLVDISGSMEALLSKRGDLNRLAGAKALAMLLVGVCEQSAVYRFDDQCELVAPATGLALDWTIGPTRGGTRVGAAVRHVLNDGPWDRIVIITDEQSHDQLGAPPAGTRGYVLNVGTYQNGIAYESWIHINGFSEAVVRWIQLYEGVATEANMPALPLPEEDEDEGQ